MKEPTGDAGEEKLDFEGFVAKGGDDGGDDARNLIYEDAPLTNGVATPIEFTLTKNIKLLRNNREYRFEKFKKSKGPEEEDVFVWSELISKKDHDRVIANGTCNAGEFWCIAQQPGVTTYTIESGNNPWSGRTYLQDESEGGKPVTFAKQKQVFLKLDKTKDKFRGGLKEDLDGEEVLLDIAGDRLFVPSEPTGKVHKDPMGFEMDIFAPIVSLKDGVEISLGGEGGENAKVKAEYVERFLKEAPDASACEGLKSGADLQKVSYERIFDKAGKLEERLNQMSEEMIKKQESAAATKPAVNPGKTDGMDVPDGLPDGANLPNGLPDGANLPNGLPDGANLPGNP